MQRLKLVDKESQVSMGRCGNDFTRLKQLRLCEGHS